MLGCIDNGSRAGTVETNALMKVLSGDVAEPATYETIDGQKGTEIGIDQYLYINEHYFLLALTSRNNYIVSYETGVCYKLPSDGYGPSAYCPAYEDKDGNLYYVSGGSGSEIIKVVFNNNGTLSYSLHVKASSLINEYCVDKDGNVVALVATGDSPNKWEIYKSDGTLVAEVANTTSLSVSCFVDDEGYNCYFLTTSYRISEDTLGTKYELHKAIFYPDYSDVNYGEMNPFTQNAPIWTDTKDKLVFDTDPTVTMQNGVFTVLDSRMIPHIESRTVLAAQYGSLWYCRASVSGVPKLVQINTETLEYKELLIGGGGASWYQNSKDGVWYQIFSIRCDNSGTLWFQGIRGDQNGEWVTGTIATDAGNEGLITVVYARTIDSTEASISEIYLKHQ